MTPGPTASTSQRRHQQGRLPRPCTESQALHVLRLGLNDEQLALTTVNSALVIELQTCRDEQFEQREATLRRPANHGRRSRSVVGSSVRRAPTARGERYTHGEHEQPIG